MIWFNRNDCLNSDLLPPTGGFKCGIKVSIQRFRINLSKHYLSICNRRLNAFMSCNGWTDRSWSMICTDQAPRFGMHVMRGLIAKFNHNRLKVYHLYLFTQASNFKPFQCKKRQKGTLFVTRALFSQPHTHREARLTAREHQTEPSFLSPSLLALYIKLWQNTHLDNHSGKCNRLCLKWTRTAEKKKKIGCESLYWIHASGLKGAAAYKYLLLSCSNNIYIFFLQRLIYI